MVHDPGGPEDTAPGWLDRAIRPFVSDLLLWPVLIVLIGHGAAFGGAVLLLALRDGSVAGWGALVVLVAVTGAFVSPELRARRAGLLCALAGSTWVLSVAFAWLSNRYDVF